MARRSFDVFDTLIARRHYDTDTVLKDILSTKLLEARKAADTGNRSLHEIYQAIKDDGQLPEYVTVDDCVAMEVEAEERQVIGIKETMGLVQDGDILVSDMYLSGADILRLCRAAGLDKQVTIYQSNGDKRTGEFWQKMKGQLQVEAHFGDNHLADIQNAIAHGFNGVLYDKVSKVSSVENMLRANGLPSLSKLVREVRLSNHEPEHQYVFEMAHQLNLPWLFIACEMIYRARGLTRPLVFLGRDCQLMEQIYHTYYSTNTYYLPFSRQAAQDRDAALVYLKTQAPKDAIYIDISSTGATWERLNSGLEVFVLIYSDLYHYTPTKPDALAHISWATRNSTLGQTNEVLEVFNCADHGKLEKIELVNGVPLATFGKHEIYPHIVKVIHKPVNDATKLRGFYEKIVTELNKLPSDKLSDMLRQFSMSICANTAVLDKVDGYLEKDQAYTHAVAK
jgi:predicted HAD superfamily hydrolase